jgi:hypothetical protein
MRECASGWPPKRAADAAIAASVVGELALVAIAVLERTKKPLDLGSELWFTDRRKEPDSCVASRYAAADPLLDSAQPREQIRVVPSERFFDRNVKLLNAWLPPICRVLLREVVLLALGLIESREDALSVVFDSARCMQDVTEQRAYEEISR